MINGLPGPEGGYSDKYMPDDGDDIDETDIPPHISFEKRFRWLDLYRGIVIVLFLIALLLYPLSGDILTGIAPIGPVYLNHGYRISPTLYQERNINFPAPITIIDLGQGTFIFLIGFLQAIAYKRRMLLDPDGDGEKLALKHAFFRAGIFFMISIFVYDIYLQWGFYDAVFNGVIANIAWASLVPPVLFKIIKERSEMLKTAIAVSIIHFVLYAIPEVREAHIGSGEFYFEVPFVWLGLESISIFGFTVSLYWFDDSGKVDVNALRKHVIPFGFLAFITAFFIDFLQWADQPHCNAAMIYLVVGWDVLSMFLAYSMDEIGVHIKIVENIGKNMFVMFFIAPAIALTISWAASDLIRSSPLWAILFVGIIPFVLISLIAEFLARRNIILKI